MPFSMTSPWMTAEDEPGPREPARNDADEGIGARRILPGPLLLSCAGREELDESYVGSSLALMRRDLVGVGRQGPSCGLAHRSEVDAFSTSLVLCTTTLDLDVSEDL